MWQNQFGGITDQKDAIPLHTIKLVAQPSSPPPVPPKPSTKTVEVQTIEYTTTPRNTVVESTTSNQDLEKANRELVMKEQTIDQLKNKMKDLEMKVSLFRQQIGDKQSQITFYERHILELQNKKEEVHTNGAGGDNFSVGLEPINSNNEELITLKVSNI